jgi:ribulose-5-phosphate 4-epimerase/fuculose-1-phosphate aldolase
VREKIATACRVLAVEGLVEGTLGHVSARAGPGQMLIRCRGPRERGLLFSEPDDIRRVDFDGHCAEAQDEWSPPKELPIHAEVYRSRPDAQAVVHAHPPAALLCGLAGLTPPAVFGAYNIPAMRIALAGVPVYPRPILITRAELAAEMVRTMEGRDVCLLAGHGITVLGDSVEQATVRAVNLNVALSVTVELAKLGASPPTVAPGDLAELPDLGSRFNDLLGWQSLAAKADAFGPPRG